MISGRSSMLWQLVGIVRIGAAVLLLAFSVTAFGALRIGSWNVLHLGWNNDKNWQAMAAVAAQFDVLAAQEVMEPAALARLDQALERYTGVVWGHLASEAEGHTSYQEHYGFVWREDKIRYTGKAASYLDDKDYFAREPFSAAFERIDNGKTLALATVHIRFGDSQTDRRPEIKALGKYWLWFADAYSDADLYVLTGDMNMPPDDPSWAVLDKSARQLIQAGQSTLSTTPGEYASLYDQIIVADNQHMPAQYTAGVFVYPAAYDWGWGVREHISDHLPVFLVLGATEWKPRPFDANLMAALGQQLGGENADGQRQCIRLNAASVDALDQLPHIGPARAEDIVAGRPWHRVHDLVAIDGLGAARVGDIADSGMLCPVDVEQ